MLLFNRDNAGVINRVPRARIIFATVFLVPILTTLPRISYASGDATVSGLVIDSSNGERMSSATVQVKGTKIGAYTNKKGYFVLQGITPGAITLRISYIGYRVRELPMTLVAGESRTMNISLVPEQLQGENIVIEGQRDAESDEIRISSITMTPDQIRRLPPIGESDLFRALQFLPGVQAISDFSSGLYIRGGSPDQNLILLDGTIVYNPSHLFGFFSTFDPDAIKSVELIKGGFPAEYGGRLSAVLSVENRDGNRRAYEGKVSIGLVSSHASVQGPLPWGSFFLSGRRTYVDVLLAATNAQNNFNNGNPLPSYYFYDVNGKVSFDLPDGDHLMFSGYFGADVLNYGSTNAFDFSMNWINDVASGHFTHVFNDKLFGVFLVSGSRFQNLLSGSREGGGYSFVNEILDYTARADISWYASQSHLIKFGVYGSATSFLLKSTIGTDSTITNISLKPKLYGGYVQDDWKLDTNWTVQAGLRTDAMDIANRRTLDPRIALRYVLSPEVTLKAAWGIYHQYLHLATPERQQFFDIWLPTDSTVQASAAIQYVAGVETHPIVGYNFNVDVYSKSITDLTEYRSAIAGAKNVADAFFIGAGKAYGAEFFLERTVGAVTGWIGYTLAWVTEQFPDINGGRTFSPKYDRRNDISVVSTWQATPEWRFGATWVYGSGQAFTDVIGRFEVDLPGVKGNTIRYPGDRGGLRLPPYHRMDISAMRTVHIFGYPGELGLQIFNVYNHHNVFSIAYDTRVNPAQQTTAYMLPILPTATLEVTF